MYVILKIGDGDFEQGFLCTLQVGKDGCSTSRELNGRLPPASTILEQYTYWQSSYRERGIGSSRGLEAEEAQTTRFSIQDSVTELKKGINNWLNSGNEEFRPIRDQMLVALNDRNDEIRFMIQTKDVRLWRLPWHVWNILERNRHVEVALSLPDFEEPKSPKTPQVQVRILVILGESPDINVHNDLKLLQQRLPDANINIIRNPQRVQLSNELWKQNWDILFFAGHSSSDGGEDEGRFYISQTESLTIDDLKLALIRAIECGLKLAIFNSCDGLGLARQLASLGMPEIIVMRERMPDQAAQKFLEYFLEAFAQSKKSLYASVREARERLHSEENRYPCASWMPVICQNPATVPLTWQDMCNSVSDEVAQSIPNPPVAPTLPGRNNSTRKWLLLQTVLLSVLLTLSPSLPKRLPFLLERLPFHIAISLPQSSFQNTCFTISITGNNISAKCKGDHGGDLTTISVPGIRNYDGNLEFVGFNNPSNFQDSNECKSISITKDIISGYCRKNDGSYNKTSIKVPSIHNQQGILDIDLKNKQEFSSCSTFKIAKHLLYFCRSNKIA